MEVDIKGSGRLFNYFYGDSGYWPVAIRQVLGGNTSTPSDGGNAPYLYDKWAHYEVRFTLASSGNANINKKLLFRLDDGEAEAYIKNIKFYKINSN